MSGPPPPDDAGSTAPLPQKRPPVEVTVARPQPQPTPETLGDAAAASADRTLPRAASDVTLIGPFEIRGQLGGGTFGLVYLAYDATLQREVAIKVPRDGGLSAEAKAVFLKEARATATIHHANVCPVYGADTHDEIPYFVMRFVPSTLEKLLDRLRGAMRPRTAVAVARKLALGLVAAHAQGVVHRDLKPANVLYDEANSEVLIADFGLARIVDTSVAASTGGGKGTPLYMSPEQCSPAQFGAVGPLSDVYSLGVIFYEMLTGKVPFGGNVWEVMRDHCETAPRAPSLVRPALDPALDALCLTAIAKRPADRYPSARAFADALLAYLNAPPRADSSKNLPLVPPALPMSEVRAPLLDDELPIAEPEREEPAPYVPPPPPPPPARKEPPRPRRLTELNLPDDPPPREVPRARPVRRKRRVSLLWLVIGFVLFVVGGFVLALVLAKFVGA